MSGRLHRFLACVDLNELAGAAAAIESLGPEEQAHVRLVVAGSGSNRALGNLLMYPHLIPAPLRLSALADALDRTEAPYLVLAAVVGLQNIERDEIEPEDWHRIRGQLMGVLALADGLVAERASVTLFQLARRADAEVLAPYGRHVNAVVRHNTLALLLRVGDHDRASELARALDADGTLSPGTAAEVLEVLASGDVGQGAIPSELSAPLLTRIPNHAATRGGGSGRDY